MLDFAYRHLGQSEARAWSWKSNTASTLVNNKVGYELLGETMTAHGDLEYEWYLDLKSWGSLRAQASKVSGLTRECLYLLGVEASCD